MRSWSSHSQRSKGFFLASPLTLWFLLFLVAPLFIVLSYSTFEKGTYGGIIYDPTIQNYLRALDPLYLKVFANSLKLAGITTLFCLIIGYPMAYTMATVRPAMRWALLFLLVIPFLTNFVVKAYAIKTLLGLDGPINRILISAGIFSEAHALGDSSWSVGIGMVTNYLPFMVFPLFVVLDRFEFSLFEAGRDLGASSLQLISKILIPLTWKGILTGSLLVFMPALGEFVIPDLLGGARTMLYGNLITEQFLKARDWPFGSALSVFLFIIVFIGFIIELVVKKEEHA